MDLLNFDVIVNFYTILLMFSQQHLTNLFAEMFVEHRSLRVYNLNRNCVFELALQWSSSFWSNEWSSNNYNLLWICDSFFNLLLVLVWS
jgi:hypothetical protein